MKVAVSAEQPASSLATRPTAHHNAAMAVPPPDAHPNLGRLSPQITPWVHRLLRPLVRALWRPTLTGLEQLPDGPFLLVANHSAGIGLAELLSFVALYAEQAGPGRPLAGFAQSASHGLWPISHLHRHVGTIPSTYEAAAATLRQGVPILVFPGGDHESLQAIWTPNRVDFGGRVGFLRIAHQHQVPLVPLGIRNGAWTAPLLLRARWLANVLVLPRLLFGTKRWAVSLLSVGVVVALATSPLAWPWQVLLCWLCMATPLGFVPWVPCTLRFAIGAPLPPPSTDWSVELARIQSAVQALVDSGGQR